MRTLVAFGFVGLAFLAGCGKQPTAATGPKVGAETSADFDKGMAAHRANNHAEAVELLKKGIDSKALREDLLIDAYRARAKSALELGKVDIAIEDVTKALEMEKTPEFYQIRAKAYTKKGDQASADKDVAEMKKLDPKMTLDGPAAEAPKAEAPKADAPKADEAKKEEPKKDEAKKDAPKDKK